MVDTTRPAPSAATAEGLVRPVKHDPLHPAAVAARIARWPTEGVQGPTTLELYPTLLCNLSCRFCDTTLRHRKPTDELSPERLLGLVDEAAAAGVGRVFVLGGGEPLLRRDATPALLRRVKEHGMDDNPCETTVASCAEVAYTFPVDPYLFERLPDVDPEGPAYMDANWLDCSCWAGAEDDIIELTSRRSYAGANLAGKRIVWNMEQDIRLPLESPIEHPEKVNLQWATLEGATHGQCHTWPAVVLTASVYGLADRRQESCS